MSAPATTCRNSPERPGLTGTELEPRFLLFGHDTIECSYYAKAVPGCSIDFDQLGALRESLRLDKQREAREVELSGESFLLQPYGSSTGYPFVLCCQRATISCGPQNVPMFHVKWNSGALWREGIRALHGWFLDWLERAGFEIERPETLSRVDATFDYYLPVVDFDSDSFVSLSTKDAQYRADRVVQTFDFGRGDVKLRVYNKVAEIREQSPEKTWFFDLWGISENVWRIEWQVRKDVLRRFAIRTVESLLEQQGDMLRYLADEHDSLRVRTTDSNRSRWPRHRLWVDLQAQIDQLPSIGIYRDLAKGAGIEERLQQIAFSVYGSYKQIAAIAQLQGSGKRVSLPQAMRRVDLRIRAIHDTLDWDADVERRTAKLRHAPQ